MNVDSKYYRLLLVSPWTLLVFLVIPVLVILSVTLNFRIAFIGSTRPLLINNICFAVVAGCRLVRYLLAFNRPIRYGAACCRPDASTGLAAPLADTRAKLAESGFSFTPDGSYGEAKDSGYIGTTVLYFGLFLLLSVGSWDNLRQFSGVLLDGMGPATDLNRLESYRSINKGLFPAIPKSLPRLQIHNQLLPDSVYPLGASDVSFIAENGKAERLILIPRNPVSFDRYDIYMSKLVFEPQIVIKTRESTPLFDSIVRLDPLVQKRGEYSFYGLFNGFGLVGGVYYQPEKSSLKVVVSRGDKKIVSDLVFQVDQEATQGDYIISCAKMGQWSEIHIVHRRHKGTLMAGAVLTVLGLLVRIMIRPKRVWLETSAAGCVVSSVGANTGKILGSGC